MVPDAKQLAISCRCTAHSERFIYTVCLHEPYDACLQTRTTQTLPVNAAKLLVHRESSPARALSNDAESIANKWNSPWARRQRRLPVNDDKLKVVQTDTSHSMPRVQAW